MGSHYEFHDSSVSQGRIADQGEIRQLLPQPGTQCPAGLGVLLIVAYFFLVILPFIAVRDLWLVGIVSNGIRSFKDWMSEAYADLES